jgi:hypothetical protein
MGLGFSEEAITVEKKKEKKRKETRMNSKETLN